jgi:hypothetical protein
MKLTWENRSTRGKICSSATLSTTNPTWTNPESNPGLRGKSPATNRLNHGTAFFLGLMFSFFRLDFIPLQTVACLYFSNIPFFLYFILQHIIRHSGRVARNCAWYPGDSDLIFSPEVG